MKSKFKKNQKILFLCQLPPPIHGASLMNHYVVNSELLQANFKLIVLPLRFIDEISEIGKTNLKKIWLMFLLFFRLIKTLVKENPNLVYFTVAPVGGAFYRDFVYLLLFKLFRKKVLIHLHGKGIKKEASKNLIKKIIYRLAFHNSIVICLAEVLKNDINDIHFGKVYTLSNGIPKINKYSNIIHKGKKVNFLYLSALDLSKGILVLVEAVRILKQKGFKDFHLNIIGNSTKTLTIEDLKEKIEKNGLVNLVSVLGPKYNAEKWEYLSKAQIFILPTKKDCFPISILEALQFGLPVISTDEGAIPEIVEDTKTGFIVEKDNELSLADSMEWFIRNQQQLPIFEDYAKKEFENKFTIEVFEKRLLEILKLEI